MRKIIIVCFSLGILGSGDKVMAQQEKTCNDVTIVAYNWQSAEFFAALDKLILQIGYTCQTEMIAGDPTSAFTSMIEKGAPDISSESWVETLPDITHPGIEEGRLVIMGSALSEGGQQGWYIPKYIADAHPEIKTIADALEHPEIFPSHENPAKGEVINAPQGYANATVTAQIFKAYDGELKGFVLTDSGSAAGLDGAIARAYERQQSVLAFYWEPTSLLGRYDMVRLDAGSHDPEEWRRCTTQITCLDPKPNGWSKPPVYTTIAAPFAKRAPQEVLDYLAKRSLDNKTLNGFLAWMSENQATGDEGARYFLKQAPDIWRGWVSNAAAEKIAATIL